MRGPEVLGGVAPLTVETVGRIAAGAPVVLDASARDRLARAHRQLETLARGRPRGLRPQHRAAVRSAIVPCRRPTPRASSSNLVRSHASGLGPPHPREVVRATMAVRAHTLAQGRSAVRPAVVETLVAMLNADIVPARPRDRLGRRERRPGRAGARGARGGGRGAGRARRPPRPGGRGALADAGTRTARARGSRGAGAHERHLVRGRAGGARRASAPSDLVAVAESGGRARHRGASAATPRRSTRACTRSARTRGRSRRPRTCGALLAGSRRLRDTARARRARRRARPAGPGRRTRCAACRRCWAPCARRSRTCARSSTVEINAVTDNPTFFPEDDVVLHAGNFHGQPLALAVGSSRRSRWRRSRCSPSAAWRGSSTRPPTAGCRRS